MMVSAVVLRDGSDLRFLGAAVTNSRVSPSLILKVLASAGTRRHKREGLKGYRLHSVTYTRQKKVEFGMRINLEGKS